MNEIAQNLGTVVALGLAVALGLSLVAVGDARKRLSALEADKKRLRSLLDHDPLTGCFSRRYFMARMAQVLADPNRGGLTLAIVDIDHFKSLNDTWGHAAGDAFLVRAAEALRQGLGKVGTVARLGGDEFWIALPGTDRARASRLADELRALVCGVDIGLSMPGITRSASIGVALAEPGTPLEQAMGEADTALYVAKGNGRNRVVVSDDLVRKRMVEDRARPSMDGIREGIDRKEFTYFLQPIFDLDTATAVGAEALLRWIRPDGTVLLPADFMARLTDRNPMAVDPPLHIASQIAMQLASLDPPLFTSYNISSSFLPHALGQESRWLDKLIGGLEPRQTVLEVVENAEIGDRPRTLDLLRDLRTTGIRIALDDFGTGRSNLMRLRDLPVDIVKIDRSFLSLDDDAGKNAAILRALVSMSQDLGFEIIAEGVETPAQLDRLRDFGITRAQGFLLGAPERAESWLSRLAVSSRMRTAAE